MIILADPTYNPNFIGGSNITSATKLAPGVSIAKFLGAYGDKTSFTHITSSEERLQIARNLYLHAELYRTINGNSDLFNDVRLVVSEGIYREGEFETASGLNVLKKTGLCVAYQVVNQDGTINHEKTFDVAEFWKDNVFFDRIALDYDTYNPDGTLTSQVVVEMPKVPESFSVSFGMNVSTNYNGTVMTEGELIEVLEK